jgi:hypothetical protein
MSPVGSPVVVSVVSPVSPVVPAVDPDDSPLPLPLAPPELVSATPSHSSADSVPQGSAHPSFRSSAETQPVLFWVLHIPSYPFEQNGVLGDISAQYRSPAFFEQWLGFDSRESHAPASTPMPKAEVSTRVGTRVLAVFMFSKPPRELDRSSAWPHRGSQREAP